MLFCTVEKTVCGLYWFAGHCDQVDVIPVWSDPGEYCTWRLWPCAQFGDGSPGLYWFGVLLVMETSMDVLMCFQADVLLEILRVRVSGRSK